MRKFQSVFFSIGMALGCSDAGVSGGSDAATTDSSDGHEPTPAESEAESEEIQVVCEKQTYTEDQFNVAFAAARQALEDQGYAVPPAIWEDEEGFERLVDAMVEALGCESDEEAGSNSQRRYGPATCEVVTEVSADGPESGVFYCGEEARRGAGCPWYRRLAGSCLNRACWAHDLCYENLVAESGPICIWSNDTESCDTEFHIGTATCVARFECGFVCGLIAAIATNIDLLQEAGKLQGYECLYGRCLEGRADCDEDTDNGCEIFLTTDQENCGRCGRSCDDVDICTADACSSGSCTHTLVGCDCLDGDEESCGSSVGTCFAGTRVCVGGLWSACTGAVGPSPEICDGLDNDCNGEVDDGVLNACGTCGAVPVETCNGLDDDCDGAIDEGSRVCPVGMVAVNRCFCIDTYESSRPNATADWNGWPGFSAPDDGIPQSVAAVLPWQLVTWGGALAACERAGKRLCLASEWRTACAGVSGWDYPYGESYDPAICNGWEDAIYGAVPAGSFVGCVTPLGIFDLSGNVWEWVEHDLVDFTDMGQLGASYADDSNTRLLGCTVMPFPVTVPSCASETVELDPVTGFPVCGNVASNIGFRCCL